MENSASFDILLWKDVRKSAAVLALSLFLLTALSFYSILTVTTCIAIPFLTVMLTLRAMWVLKCAFMKEPMDNPFQSWLDADVLLNEERIAKCNKSFLLVINQWMMCLRKVILIADLTGSTKVLGLLFLLYYLGNAFTGITLLFAANIIVFTVPKICDMYKAEIANAKIKFNKRYDDFYQRVRNAVPIGGRPKQKSS